MAEVQVQASKPAPKKPISSTKTSKNDKNNNTCALSTEPQVRNSVKLPPVAIPGKENTSAISKEVLNIVREMNSHVTAQGSKLEKQEERLESLFNQFSEFYNSQSEPYYDTYEESYQEEPNDGSRCDDDLDSPGEKGKSGIFKSLVDKFQQCETVDAEVNDDLALFVNSSFRNGLPDDKLNDLLKDIHRPQNCESLVKTRVNQGIWRLLKMNSQADDNKMQAIQELLVKSTSCIVKLADKNAERFDREDVEWVTSAIALLGHVNKMINIRRKETHRPDLVSKYHYLASSSLPYTDYLYGDDNDVNRNVKEINDLNKLGKPSGRGFQRRGYPRGSYSGRRFQPYQRGAFRGRGYNSGRGRQETQTTKNQKLAPKK